MSLSANNIMPAVLLHKPSPLSTVTNFGAAGELESSLGSVYPPLPSHLSYTSCVEWKREKGFWRCLTATCIPLLLSALEGSVTNTALPTISSALDLSTKFSWVATAFLLASTIFQPLYGQLGDMWGRKHPMMAALAVFAIGSAICGGARSGAVLIFGRIIQGLGTGGIDLFSEMILCDLVPLGKRGPYLAIKHSVYALGTILGPLLGGIFADYNWRWCFLINVPVCIIAIGIVAWWLQVGGGIDTRNIKFWEELSKVDLLGTFLLTLSVILILVSLSTGGALHPWTHPSVTIPLILGFTVLGAFAFYQRSKYCAHPIMPPKVFSNRTTNIAFALTTIHGFVTYGVQFYLPPFFQAVKGHKATQSGVDVLPSTLVIVVLAAVGGPLLTFWGRYKPIHIIGFSIMTLGVGLCITLDHSTPTAAWVAFQFLFASGCGIIVPCLLLAVQAKLPDTVTGQSSGSWAFLRGTGSLFGVAFPGAIFNIHFTSLLDDISCPVARAKLAHGQAYSRASRKFISQFDTHCQWQIINGFTESLKVVWIIFTVLAGLGFILTWFEKEHSMRMVLDTVYGLKAKTKLKRPTEEESQKDPEVLVA